MITGTEMPNEMNRLPSAGHGMLCASAYRLARIDGNG